MARKQVELVLAAQNKTNKAFNSVNKNITKLERNANKIKSLGNIFAGFVATAGVISTFRNIIDKTREQEAAVAQLEARLKSTGGVSGKTSEELQKMASGLQQVTTFGDEATLSMQSTLLTFTNIKGDRFDEATKSVLDMSVALKQDLKSASIQVGKALNDPIKGVTALSRSGVQFTEDQKELIKTLVDTGETAKAQGVILDELKVQFGGAAEAAADTFGGALDQLSNAFGDLLEADGDGLVSAKKEVQELTKVLQDPATKEAMAALTSGAVRFSGALAQMAANGLKVVTDGAADLGEGLAKITLEMQGASDETINFEQTLADLEHQTYLLNPPIETLADTIERIGKEADESRDLLEELGGVQIDGNITEDAQKVLDKLEEERKLLRMSAKERFIYNRVKKAGKDATVDDIKSITRTAEALFKEKEAAKESRKEKTKLIETQKDYEKAVKGTSKESKSASFGVFDKDIEDAEKVKEKTEEAAKAKRNFLAATSQGGKDTSDAFEEKQGPIDLTPEQAKEKAKEIKDAMQEEFDKDPVQVRVKTPAKSDTVNSKITKSSSFEQIGGLSSGLSAVSFARESLKEGSKA